MNDREEKPQETNWSTCRKREGGLNSEFLQDNLKNFSTSIRKRQTKTWQNNWTSTSQKRITKGQSSYEKMSNILSTADTHTSMMISQTDCWGDKGGVKVYKLYHFIHMKFKNMLN